MTRGHRDGSRKDESARTMRIDIRPAAPEASPAEKKMRRAAERRGDETSFVAREAAALEEGSDYARLL